MGNSSTITGGENLIFQTGIVLKTSGQRDHNFMVIIIIPA
jgi:hypothetical protein